MVIDFHTHAFPDALAPKAIASLVAGCKNKYSPCHNGSLDGLKKNMSAFGVDISVVQPVMTNPKQFKTINDWAAEIKNNNEEIFSFGGLHPATEDYKRDIDYICSLGLKGIKLHPEYQNFRVDDEKLFPIFDYALEKGLILLFHAGFDPAFEPPFHSSPKQFLNLWKAMKGGVIVAAHLGGQQQWNDVEEYICQSDIYIDTSMGFEYYSKEQFLRILRSHGSRKILFGSDSPWSRADKELEILNSLPVSKEEKEDILYKNAKRLLEI